MQNLTILNRSGKTVTINNLDMVPDSQTSMDISLIDLEHPPEGFMFVQNGNQVSIFTEANKLLEKAKLVTKLKGEKPHTYYQVEVYTKRQITYYEHDITNLLEIENSVIIPYLQENKFQVNGYHIQAEHVLRLRVTEMEYSASGGSEESRYECYRTDIKIENAFHWEYIKDITRKVLSEARDKIALISTSNKNEITNKTTTDKTKVFIVHGHDDSAKTEIARFIEKMGFEAIILHEQVSSGATIIEKIEQYSNVGFGVVLYTPCDVGAKKEKKTKLKDRARQNVVFEHGFLNGKLNRKNVCALVKGDIETPNDISGVVYVPMDTLGAWKIALSKEMKSSGYVIDMNEVI